jgi:predicted dehydrogenase
MTVSCIAAPKNFARTLIFMRLWSQQILKVIVEKPVGMSLRELEKMKETAEKYKVSIMPGHNYIYEPWMQRTKQLIMGGTLGKITSFYMTYNIHHPKAVAARYPGVIRQILTHHAYTSLYLLGKRPETISAFKSTINNGSVEQENVTMANFVFEGGTLAHLQVSILAYLFGVAP